MGTGPLKTAVLLVPLLFAPAAAASAQEADFKGYVEPEYRWFPATASDARQMEQGLSVALEATFEIEWDRGDHNIVFTPFGRIDGEDDERQHFDIRKLRYEGVFDSFELRVGYDKVYWGVTEFAHLVDVINQTDGVESVDGEEKLGQPMVNLAIPTDLGTLDIFVMPFFGKELSRL